MSTQDNTAVIAIVIACIAFFVTVAQLLQQIFGTAVGYRNCQESVIGKWAAYSKRLWRWSEFRFETKFTTPHIVLCAVDQTPKQVGLYQQDPITSQFTLLTDHPQSRRNTLMDGIESGADNSDLVGWITLLDRLHRLQGQLPPSTYWDGINFQKNLVKPQGERQDTVVKSINTMTCPTISLRQRSWDLVPPDVIRPFASSTVGDVIVLTHRLGMAWSELRPGEGVMRAEGNGLTLTSSPVRGFGILLQFTQDIAVFKNKKHPWRDTMIPSEEADKLGFQVIPGDQSLGCSDFALDNSEKVGSALQAMDDLGIGSDIQARYAVFMKASRCYFGFSDLIGLVTPYLPLPESSISQVMTPYWDAQDSPTRAPGGFVVFEKRLADWPEPLSSQMDWVLSEYRRMRHLYFKGVLTWDKGATEANECSVGYLEDCGNLWRETTARLMDLVRDKFNYIDLVAAHIAQAVCYPDLLDGVKDDVVFGQAMAPLGPWFKKSRPARAMHIYIKQLDKVVEYMRQKAEYDTFNIEQRSEYDPAVRDSWWTMMLRAMCWHRGIHFTGTRGAKGNTMHTSPVNSSFWGSRTPVYIT